MNLVFAPPANELCQRGQITGTVAELNSILSNLSITAEFDAVAGLAISFSIIDPGKPQFVSTVGLAVPAAITSTHSERKIDRRSDGSSWTVVTADRKYAAHSEHTIAITKDGPEILTLTKEQKKELKQSKAETVAA